VQLAVEDMIPIGESQVQFTKNKIMGVSGKKPLSPEQLEKPLKALKTRFEKNLNRHKDSGWEIL
jgi:hypothetical protein